MTLVVLTRHAESEWNSQRRLTGWSDPPLSAKGAGQARHAGERLASFAVSLDRVYTSMLDRATQTAATMMAAAGARRSVPVESDWRLNERHLGRLEGLTKAEVTAAWGNERRRMWRDDTLAWPPPLDPDDPDHPRRDPRYRNIPTNRLPAGERGIDVDTRVLDFWRERIVPDISAGRNIMVVTHLGPLRVLARHLGCSGQSQPRMKWPNAELVLCQVGARTGSGRA